MNNNGTRSRRLAPAPTLEAPAQTLATPTLATPAQTLAAPAQTLATPAQTLATPAQTLATPAQTLATPAQTLATPAQTLATPAQTLAAPAQATKPRRRSILGSYSPTTTPRQRLLDAAVAFDVATRDEAVRAALAAHGYDNARLGVGQALLAAAQAQYDQRGTAEQTRRSARQADMDATAQAYASYNRQIALARVALRDNPAASAALGLAAPRRRSRASWQGQAQELYATVLANPALAEALAAYGISADEVAESQRRVAALAVSQGARQHTQQQAAAATRARKQAMAALDRWMHDFLAVARIALARRAA